MVKQPEKQSRHVEITRDVTFIPTVVGEKETSPGHWQYLLDATPDIAMILLRRIGPSTIHELKKVASSLREKEVRGIILDVRHGGGTLHDTVMLADQFLEQGTIGFVRDRWATTKHESLSGSIFRGIPLAVVIAGTSNADRVYLAAALQDNNRAIVVGEPTDNDPFVRSHVELPGGDRLLMTTGLLQRSDGTTLRARTTSAWHPLPSVIAERNKQPERKPHFVMPDHVVRFPLANEDRLPVKEGMDPMISKAIDVLRNPAKQARTDEGNGPISG